MSLARTPARATCMMLVKRTQCGAPTTMGCLCCQVGVDQLAKHESAHADVCRDQGCQCQA